MIRFAQGAERAQSRLSRGGVRPDLWYASPSLNRPDLKTPASRLPLWIRKPLTAALLLLAGPSLGQLSPFPDSGSQFSGGRDLRDILPPDLIEPVINPRQSSADRIARLFNRELRDLEEAQADIIVQLDKLPRVTREIQRVTGFGYHSGNAKQRPKWVQIDMGEPVSPDGIALFPVTAEVDDQTIYGYGFPKGFRIDISNEAGFGNYETIVEGRSDEAVGLKRWPYYREVQGYSGRYIRVTATGMWRSPSGGQEVFALSEIMVLKGGRNLAVGKAFTALDSEERADQWSQKFLCDGITTLGIPHGEV